MEGIGGGRVVWVARVAAVSTTDQSLDIQIAALKADGCEKIRSSHERR
jgi:hypothetical protein